MEKKYFFIKLNPGRPDFVQTMTDHERTIMQQHTEYWQPYLSNGVMIVLGPVLDPKGAYGVSILAVDHEDHVKDLLDNDPASKINNYEWHPMLALVKQ